MARPRTASKQPSRLLHGKRGSPVRGVSCSSYMAPAKIGAGRSFRCALAASRRVGALLAWEPNSRYIHVQDAADGLVTLLASSADGAFNIASGQAVTIRTIVEESGTSPVVPSFSRDRGHRGAQ